MTKMTGQFLMKAAVAGIIGAAAIGMATPAHAADANGQCMGANACKGKSGCKTAANECKGQNACKGKGFMETSEKKCEKMSKKDKTIHFEAAAS